MKSWFKNKWNKGKMLAELKPALFLSLTFCFMIFIYAPLEFYINNSNEFWYDAYLLFPFIFKDFLLFFTSVQKKRPFCFNKSGRESRTADPVFPSCDPQCRCREASWLAIPLDRDLSKELPAFLIFIIHQ